MRKIAADDGEGCEPTSSETGSMAGDARDAAVDLSQQAETLKREVDGFIMSVRAG